MRRRDCSYGHSKERSKDGGSYEQMLCVFQSELAMAKYRLLGHSGRMVLFEKAFLSILHGPL